MSKFSGQALAERHRRLKNAKRRDKRKRLLERRQRAHAHRHHFSQGRQ